MKRARVLVLFTVILLLAATVAAPISAQAEFTCNDGSGVVVTNGVEFGLSVAPGDYRVTAIGLNGFDPVIAVVELAENGGGHICNDDEAAASGYAAVLPTAGDVPSSNLSAQVDFSNSGDGFMDAAILVSDRTGAGGEFIVVLEGMSVSTDDGDGDLYWANFAGNIVPAGVGVNTYVFHIDPQFDPVLVVVDGNNQVTTVNGNNVACDDAADAAACWYADPSLGTVSLANASLSDGSNTVVGDDYDPVIFVPVELLDGDAPYDNAFINYLVTGAMYQQGMSTGAYVVVFHTAVAGPAAGGGTTGNSGNSGSLGNTGGSLGNSGNSGNTGNTGSSGGPTTVADVTPIDCSVTGQQVEGDVNTFLNVECPANCTSGSLWGTNVYTDDSSVCTAAIHAGIIPASGGQFALVIMEGQDEYTGSTQNGITSSSWSSWERSIMPQPIDASGGTTGNSGTSSSSGTSTDVTLQPINFGEPVNGQISSAAGDAYVFTAEARDVVTIALDSEDFDPLIIVTDGNGRELTRDDDSGPGFNALISNLRLPNAGEYIILVTSFSGAVEVGSAYSLGLSGG